MCSITTSRKSKWSNANIFLLVTLSRGSSISTSRTITQITPSPNNSIRFFKEPYFGPFSEVAQTRLRYVGDLSFAACLVFWAYWAPLFSCVVYKVIPIRTSGKQADTFLTYLNKDRAWRFFDISFRRVQRMPKLFCQMLEISQLYHVKNYNKIVHWLKMF